MISPFLKYTFLVYLSFVFQSTCFAQVLRNEQEILATMRTIGHEVLKDSGDDFSLVLPIQSENGRYKIEFDTEFQFYPDKLSATIDHVLKKANIQSDYVVEVENCTTGEIVYNYTVNKATNLKDLPCLTRIPDKNCYTIFFSFIGLDFLPRQTTVVETTTVETHEGGFKYLWIGGLLLALSLVFLFVYFPKVSENASLSFRKKSLSREINEEQSRDSHQLNVGIFVFDTKNNTLESNGIQTELSSKEGDLLFMLFTAENETLEREYILQHVWGDDGDYIGRTLDVFISKLRKKLENDPNIKIVNVRGVGYKMLVNKSIV